MKIKKERKKIINFEDAPSLLAPQHMADLCGISRRRVYEFCLMPESAGGIKSFTIGKSRKIFKEDLINWLESQKGEHYR
jgi:hypothetical protein